MDSIQEKRMLKLADYLENVVSKHPIGKDGQKKFDMAFWFLRSAGCKATKPGITPASCGTSACALGWATVVFPRQLKLTRPELVDDWFTDATGKYQSDVKFGNKDGFLAAAAFFGITEDAADDLFGPENRSAKQEAKILRSFVKGNQRQKTQKEQ